MDISPKYNPKYAKSWGLVIGINEYTRVTPLSFARNDAIAIAGQLTRRFGFPAGNVTVLLDKEASLEAIRAALARLHRVTEADDRVIIFFAGHGHTLSGNRRQSGFLVPVDGHPDDTSSLLPWDELVVAGNIIRAKHILYIMDACYSGLIAMRKLAAGSARIIRDMLTRYSRQYLTAGKADQPVADGGGPRKGHSIFTGHLLDALDGGVSSSDGLIGANAVMAYVFDRVGKDPHSQQTPHYGFLEGDGDFFFTEPQIALDSASPKDTHNELVVVPADLEVPEDEDTKPAAFERVKEYLSDPRYRIRLNDVVMRELRGAQQQLGNDKFPVQGRGISSEEFAARLKRYEIAMSEVLRVSVLLGRWRG